MADVTVQPKVTIRRLAWLDMLRESMIWVALFAVVLLIAAASPVFLSPQNILNILRQISILGIVAIGMTFPLISGSFDLSVGATMGFATVVAIQLQPKDLPSAIAAIAAALLLGIVVGIINGSLIGIFKTNSVVTTIGTMYMVWGATLIYTQSKHVWVFDMFLPMEALGTGYIGPFPVPVLILAATAVLGHVALNYTRFGRYVYATGGNSEAARLSGVNTARTRLIAFMSSGVAAAMAGIIIAARVKNVDPSFGIGYEFEALTAVVLGGTSLFGGRGSVSGTVAGVLLLGVLANAMTLLNVSFNYQLMIKGIILILAVAADVIARTRRR